MFPLSRGHDQRIAASATLARNAVCRRRTETATIEDDRRPEGHQLGRLEESEIAVANQLNAPGGDRGLHLLADQGRQAGRSILKDILVALVSR